MGRCRVRAPWVVVASLGATAVACGGADSGGLFGSGSGDSAGGGKGPTGGAAGEGGAPSTGGVAGNAGAGGDDCVGADCPEAPCGGHSECLSDEYCDGETCVPDVCVPRVAECVGNVLVTCNEVGDSRLEEPCLEEHTCEQRADGATCVPWVCLPGERHCEQSTIIECSPDGLFFVSDQDCAEQEMLCEAGQCEPLPPDDDCPPTQPTNTTGCQSFGRSCAYGPVTCTCWAVWTCGQ